MSVALVGPSSSSHPLPVDRFRDNKLLLRSTSKNRVLLAQSRPYCSMVLSTRLTEKLGLSIPVIGAPMAGPAGAKLAAAVARAGGLGMLGAALFTPEQIAAEYQEAISLLHADADEPHRAIGIGLINFAVKPATLEAAINCKPRAIWLSFGKFEGLVEPIKAAGIKLIAQVQTLEQVREAISFGADAVVVQGYEAGGHGASTATTFCLVPEAVDACEAHCRELGIPPVPIVAAGGVADGRQVAAALVLGADGVVLGSRLTATPEAAYPDSVRDAVVQAASDASSSPSTIRTRLYDVISGAPWPQGIDGRYLRNAFTAAHHDSFPQASASELAELKRRVAAAEREGPFDLQTGGVCVGSGVGLIRSVEPAETLVTQLVKEAGEALGTLQRMSSH